MSDQWEFYPCTIGDKPAFIFYDHGIADSIDTTTCNTALKLRLILNHPNEQGLPADTEFDALTQIEDDISQWINTLNGQYVGRISVDGARYFNYFVNITEDKARGFVQSIADKYDYEIGFYVEDDPQKEAYWEDLFPDEVDWQVIQDRKVIDQLDQNGNDHDIKRDIEHWFYFKTEKDRNDFTVWARQQNYKIEGTHEDGIYQHKFALQISTFGTTILNEISECTITLLSKANQFNGEYDGWGTTVEKAE